jgi:hypothetical protein
MATDTSASETPYSLDGAPAPAAEDNKGTNDVTVKVVGEEETGFYIVKNFFASKKFAVYPARGKSYKPIFLKQVDDDLWMGFNKEVQHYLSYFNNNSMFYKLWTLGPTVWFLAMILPSLLEYYEIYFSGLGVVMAVALALAFALDLYLQRRLIHYKIQPMFQLLIGTYKNAFLQAGYTLDYVLEPTKLGGLCSYILFRKASSKDQSWVMVEPSQSGYYLDERLCLGNQPFCLGFPSSSTNVPPRFFHALDAATWKSFIQTVQEKSTVPPKYLLNYSIGMALFVGPLFFIMLYCVIVLSNVRHWIVLALFPLSLLIEAVLAYRRRHYVENVLVQEINETLKEYESSFSKAGFGASFEHEYMFNYCVLNTYFIFWKTESSPSSAGNEDMA